MMTIANPIYDTVFKYLMEDTRIARTILSALLKKDVIDVKIRPHEYSNTENATLSVFRIDFGATIRDNEGNEKLILIELQKTWIETEALRFRQYLGVQYSSRNNITEEGFALPMVAVYLLGHCVGDIKEPVLYVNRQACNYDGQIVTQGLPDPFVDSLTHDSIIVQIPLLHGQINNRLDKVLSVFDQSRRDNNDAHMLKIDADAYADDAEMDHILHRLSAAAGDAQVRRNMNIEDEIFSVLKKKESQLMQALHDLAIQQEQLDQKQEQIGQQEAKLSQQQEQIGQQEAKLSQQQQQIGQQEAKLSQQQQQIGQQEAKLSQQQEQIGQQQEQLRASIKLFLDLGMSIDEIATRLGMDAETVRQLSAF